jgi:hypothetical protein
MPARMDPQTTLPGRRAGGRARPQKKPAGAFRATPLTSNSQRPAMRTAARALVGIEEEAAHAEHRWRRALEAARDRRAPRPRGRRVAGRSPCRLCGAKPRDHHGGDAVAGASARPRRRDLRRRSRSRRASAPSRTRSRPTCRCWSACNAHASMASQPPSSGHTEGLAEPPQGSQGAPP